MWTGEDKRVIFRSTFLGRLYIYTHILRSSVGGEFLFVQRRGGLFSPLGRTIYITRFRFPIRPRILQQSFFPRPSRFNNLGEQVSIFAKILLPPRRASSCLFSRNELHRINWK